MTDDHAVHSSCPGTQLPGQRVRGSRHLSGFDSREARLHSISPDMAAELSEANTANRPLSKSTVRIFGRAMRSGD